MEQTTHTAPGVTAETRTPEQIEADRQEFDAIRARHGKQNEAAANDGRDWFDRAGLGPRQ